MVTYTSSYSFSSEKALAVSSGPSMGNRPNMKIGKTQHSSSMAAGSRSISLDVPLAQVGTTIPYLLGRRRISMPNVLWYGNLRPIYELVAVHEHLDRDVIIWGGFNELTTTVTERYEVVGYHLDMQMGLCLGPGVVLRGIYYNNELIWSGNIGPNRTTITLPQNDTPLSGSQIAFSGGANDQVPDPWIENVDDLPGYVGVAYVVLRDMRIDLNLSSIQFEVERFINPLGLSNNNNRRDDDISIGTAVYDIVTNPWGGAGVDVANLELPMLVAMSNQLAAEGNFCSILIEGETPATGVLGSLQQQAFAVAYQNPATGKLEFRLVRQSQLDLGNIRKFSPRNIHRLQKFEKSAWSMTTELLRVQYVNRENNYEPTPILIQNVANTTQSGRAKRTGGVDYPFITKGDIALLVGSRDFAMVTAPQFDCTFVTNRDGAPVLPGEVVLLSWPEYGILGIPVTARKIRKSPIDQNTVIISADQFIFPDQTPVFEQPGTPFDAGVQLGAINPLSVAFYTAPFWLARRAGVISGESQSNLLVPVILPVPANDIQSSFDAFLTNKPGSNKTTMAMLAAYPTYGELSAPIGKYDSFDTGLIESITIDSVRNPVHLISDAGEQGVIDGKLLMFIGNEIMSFESSTQVGPGQWQLNNVRRNLLDTVPLPHLQGASVYIIDNGWSQVSPITFDFPLGYLPNWVLTSDTPTQNGNYNTGLNSSGWVPSVARTMRSPRPHDTKLNDQRTASTITLVAGTSDHMVTWRTRSRLPMLVRRQTDDPDPAEILPDNTRQYHRVYIRDSANTLHMVASTPNDGDYNSATITIPIGAAAGPATLFVRSVNQFGESVYDDTLPIAIWKGSDLTIRYVLEEEEP